LSARLKIQGMGKLCQEFFDAGVVAKWASRTCLEEVSELAKELSLCAAVVPKVEPGGDTQNDKTPPPQQGSGLTSGASAETLVMGPPGGIAAKVEPGEPDREGEQEEEPQPPEAELPPAELAPSVE